MNVDPCWSFNTGVSIRRNYFFNEFVPASPCIDHLTWIIGIIGGKWPYSFFIVGCCVLDFLKITHSILVYFLCSFFSPSASSKFIYCTKTRILTRSQLSRIPIFILSERSDFHMIDNISKCLFMNVLESISVDKMLLLRCLKWAVN